MSNNLVDAEMSLPMNTLPEHDLPGIEALPAFDLQDEGAEAMMQPSVQMDAEAIQTVINTTPEANSKNREADQ